MALSNEQRTLIEIKTEAVAKIYCQLLIYSDGDSDDILATFCEDLRGSPLNIKANDAGIVMIWFDAKLFAEAATQPRTRTAPVPDSKYEAVCKAVLAARVDAENAQDPAFCEGGDVVVVLDGKRSNIKKLLKPWQGPFELSSDIKTPKKKKDKVVQDNNDEDIVDLLT